MIENAKRFLALVLAACLCLSLAAPVWATEMPEAEDSAASSEVQAETSEGETSEEEPAEEAPVPEDSTEPGEDGSSSADSSTPAEASEEGAAQSDPADSAEPNGDSSASADAVQSEADPAGSTFAEEQTEAPSEDLTAESSSTVTSKSGTFYYASEQYTSKDFKATYYYKDSYFSESAYTYQDSLATMSMCMALSSFRSNRTTSYADKAQNLEAMLEECGFSGWEANSGYTNEPTIDSTGVAAAHKTIKVDGESYTLVALAICGGRYGEEWGGSFVIGTTGDAENGVAGAETAEAFLKSYLSDEGITGNVKLWMTSYGLGAGKLNLMAADLDDGLSMGSDVTIDPENMYTYCFECPNFASTNNGLNSSVYKNIFCVNNPYDVVCKLAAPDYDMGRYGVLKTYPSENGDSSYVSKRKAMVAMLNTLDGADAYLGDDFQMMKISILGDGYVEKDTSATEDADEYLDELVAATVSSIASSRKTYVSDFQDDLCDLLALAFGHLEENWAECVDFFIASCQDDLLKIGLYAVLGSESSLADLYYDLAIDALKAANITDYTKADVTQFSEVAAKIVVAFAPDHPNLSVTLFENMDVFVQMYQGPVNLAWLMSVDSNYQEGSSSGDISDCTVSLSKTAYTYDGSAKKPTVTVKNGSTTLTKGTDYTVSYSNNTNAGTAKVKVTGTGDYTGSVTKSFTINKAENTISASSFKKTYSSKARSFYLKASSLDDDATLSYKSSNKNITVNSKGKVTIKKKYIGSTTITITAEETTNYEETTTTVAVKVYPAKMSIKKLTTPKKKWLKATWSKAGGGVSGYQIELSTSTDFSNAGPTNIKSSKTSFTISGLKSGKKYYVRMRSYKTVSGKTFYGAWSKTKSIKVK